MITNNDIMLAAFHATLMARMQASGANVNTFQSMGEEAMIQALEATEGAMNLLKKRGMVEITHDSSESDECVHPEDKRDPTTAGGTKPRFYCGECGKFLEEDGDGSWFEYQGAAN